MSSASGVGEAWEEWPWTGRALNRGSGQQLGAQLRGLSGVLLHSRCGHLSGGWLLRHKVNERRRLRVTEQVQEREWGLAMGRLRGPPGHSRSAVSVARSAGTRGCVGRCCRSASSALHSCRSPGLAVRSARLWVVRKAPYSSRRARGSAAPRCPCGTRYAKHTRLWHSQGNKCSARATRAAGDATVHL